MRSAVASGCSNMLVLSTACALVLALLGPSLAAAQAAAPTTSHQTLEQRKLQLEIDKLSQETSLSAEVRAWLSAGTIFIALIGAGWGAYRYFRDQRRESRVRLEQQFAERASGYCRTIRRLGTWQARGWSGRWKISKS
jgi:hypothetical protein